MPWFTHSVLVPLDVMTAIAILNAPSTTRARPGPILFIITTSYLEVCFQQLDTGKTLTEVPEGCAAMQVLPAAPGS